MEKYDDMPPLEEAEPSHPSRGAGGKVRRQFNRRSRTTPYSRPQPNLSQAPPASGGGWLSMLVTPARRLISTGASRILPALWSPAVECPALSSDEDHETEQDEVEHLGEDEIRRENSDAMFSLSHQIPNAKIVKYGSSSTTAPDGVKDDEARDMPNNGLGEIEKMIRGKSFSRDEIERLMEILNSKTKDSAKLDGPKMQPIMAREEVQRSAMAPIFPNEAKEDQSRFDRQRQEIQTPLPKSNLRSDIGASPIDIARAYMGSRSLDIGSSSISKTYEDDKALVHVGPSNPNIPSPSRKSSTCWPGAMIPEQFSTPQTQRGRYDFHNFRRTPYSRSVNSASKFKLNQLRDDATNSLNTTSTPLKQPPTTITGQVKSSMKALDSHYASGGPIRRARHQLTTASPRKSVSFSPLPSPLHREKADVSIHSLPPFRRNADSIGASALKPQTVEDKPQSVEFKNSNVHTHSSQMAKKILEHLDRTVPTPKDMSAEFKLSNSGKKPASSDVISIGDGPDSQVGAEKDTTKHLDVGRTPLLFPAPPAEDTVKGNSSASDGGAFFTVPRGGTDATNTYENVSKFAPTSSSSQSQHPWKKPPTPMPTQKTVLPSISITKAPMKADFGPDNNTSGFTFQVSAPPSTFPEPPTPSLMLPPSLLNGDSDIPTFSFGLKKSSSTSPPLVFSFPSAPVIADASSDIKFSFGGSDKGRIDFGSTKKDAVCY